MDTLDLPLELPLNQLQPHPANSNVMPPALLEKLRTHIATTGRYPPVIVRPMPDGTHQILDGHHRVKALAALGHATARCVSWAVNDDEALLLLSTLNRLQGRDDPRKRAALLAELTQRFDRAKLLERIPEDAERLERLLTLSRAMPPPREPMRLEDLPVSVHFFLLPPERDRLEARLATLDPSRERALMQLVEGV